MDDLSSRNTKEERERLKAKPDCYSPIEWKKWSASAYFLKPTVDNWGCTDCTPEFKERAMAAGKCNWPCVQFVRTADGSIEGRRMSVKRINGPRKPDGNEE